MFTTVMEERRGEEKSVYTCTCIHTQTHIRGNITIILSNVQFVAEFRVSSKCVLKVIEMFNSTRYPVVSFN